MRHMLDKTNPLFRAESNIDDRVPATLDQEVISLHRHPTDLETGERIPKSGESTICRWQQCLP